MSNFCTSFSVTVPLEGVYDEWCDTSGPFHIKDVAEYFNVFQDLFGDAYFTPMTIVDVEYKLKDGYAPVYTGNLLKPAEVCGTLTSTLLS